MKNNEFLWKNAGGGEIIIKDMNSSYLYKKLNTLKV
jgi:hypothetical protein